MRASTSFRSTPGAMGAAWPWPERRSRYGDMRDALSPPAAFLAAARPARPGRTATACAQASPAPRARAAVI
ncbi:MAG: hypothetical protein ACLQER_24595, partial [Streptosporangiaceae bacterium]